jgi:general secretion pathway protein G
MVTKRYVRNGLVLIEILVAIVIIALLTLLEIPSTHIRYSSDPRRSFVEVQIMEIENALEIYCKHNGIYPTTEQGLEALVTKPTTDPQPDNYNDGGYMKRISLDPWGNPFVYRSLGAANSFDIISCGPDGVLGTEDDIMSQHADFP